MHGLVLSLFPGLDFLGRAFEAFNWCVVRGPDPVFASDIRGWHAPQGRFDGVIGGPPCQCFSRLANLVRHTGHEPRFGNLIPEFERLIQEVEPAWWLMEQVSEAPMPAPRLGPPFRLYRQESFELSPRDLGDPQSRKRRFTFGVLGRPCACLYQRLPLVEDEPVERIPAVTSNGQAHYAKRKISGGSKSWKHATEGAAIQGYPELGEHLRETPFTAFGACHLVGNGVPRVMGEALAGAITEWWKTNKTKTQVREAFRAALASELARHGLHLVTSNLGRAHGGVPFWNVTVRRPDAVVQTLRVDFPAGTSLYEDSTRQELVVAVLTKQGDHQDANPVRQ